jgi:hypothetical protein
LQNPGHDHKDREDQHATHRDVVTKIWSQSIARKTLLGEESQNPSIAAASLLGKKAVRRAEQFQRRKFGRKRRSPDNPLPAFIGSALGGLGGIFGGAGKKQAQREAANEATLQEGITALQSENLLGAKDALQRLFDSAGLRNPGKFGGSAIGWGTAAGRQHALQAYQRLKAMIDGAEQLTATTEAKAARAAGAARAERLQVGLLEAGTSIGGALATSFGRRGGLRRPVRRRRPRRY